MFCLPAIGVSTFARTIGHAPASFIDEASPLIMRPLSVVTLAVETQQDLSSVASAPRSLLQKAVCSFHSLHDSVRGCTTPRGARPVAAKPLAGFALYPIPESSVFVGKGERFYVGGVKCRVPEVTYP